MKIACKGFGLDEAKALAKKLRFKGDLREFVMGLNVELEHKDVTQGDLELTAKIVLAHLKERKDYYIFGLKTGFFEKKELGIVS